MCASTDTSSFASFFSPFASSAHFSLPRWDLSDSYRSSQTQCTDDDLTSLPRDFSSSSMKTYRRLHERRRTLGRQYNTRYGKRIKKNTVKAKRVSCRLGWMDDIIVDTRYFTSRPSKNQCYGWELAEFPRLVRRHRKEVHRSYHNTGVSGDTRSACHPLPTVRVVNL